MPPSARAESLTGQHGQGWLAESMRCKPPVISGSFSDRASLSSVEFSIRLNTSVDRLDVSHASLRSRLDLDRPLHALVGRSGEPCFWTRLMRSSRLRLHPDHRSHLDALTSVLGLDVDRPHAGVATAPQRNSDPSIHMRCRITASLRATAMTARRWPRVLARRTPQAFNVDHWALRVSSEWAAT